MHETCIYRRAFRVQFYTLVPVVSLDPRLSGALDRVWFKQETLLPREDRGRLVGTIGTSDFACAAVSRG